MLFPTPGSDFFFNLLKTPQAFSAQLSTAAGALVGVGGGLIWMGKVLGMESGLQLVLAHHYAVVS